MPGKTDANRRLFELDEMTFAADIAAFTLLTAQDESGEGMHATFG